MRRTLILLVCLAALWPAVARGGAFTTPHVTPPVPVIGYDEAAAVLQKLDAAWDAIPASDRAPAITDWQSAQDWQAEILPYFVSEGIVDPAKLVVPTSISFTFYQDPDYAQHVLGTTGLCGTDIELNKRIITPGDAWYADDLQLVVLAHEMSHVQGVCYGETTINDESSAQLISWEVMAAMANSGCVPCRVSLLSDLRDRTLGVAMADARLEGRQADFARLEAATLTPAERAAQDRSARQWVGRDADLADLLHDYYTIPISAWVLATDRGADTIDGVQLPVNVLQEYMPPGMTNPLRIDDLAYFWENL